MGIGIHKNIARMLTAFPILLVPLLPALAWPEVLVHDTVSLRGEEVMLTVETRGRLFPRGGKVIQFLVDGKPAGQGLSGGDGFAYKSYRPLRSGILHVSAKSDKEEGKGVILSLRKGQRVLFVGVEGPLMEDILSVTPRNGSLKTLDRLSSRFPVVLLQTGEAGAAFLKTWLNENGFTRFPVIPWDQGAVFDELKRKGLKIKAVIGKGVVIDSARETGARTFSFEEVEGAEEVDSWEQIGRKLR